MMPLYVDPDICFPDLYRVMIFGVGGNLGIGLEQGIGRRMRMRVISEG